MRKLFIFLFFLLLCSNSFATVTTYVKRYPNDTAVQVAPLSGAATSGNCVQFDANGNIISAGSPCGSGSGGGGTPGGNNTDIQYLSVSGTIRSFAGSDGFIFDGTNVGINKVSPVEKLQIGGNVAIGATAGGGGFPLDIVGGQDSNYYEKIQNGNMTTSARTGLKLQNDTSGHYGLMSMNSTNFTGSKGDWFAIANGSPTGPLVFSVASETPKMLLDSNGNFGIDVLTPKNALDVSGGQVIGATYAGTNTAPSNGLLVQGNVGIGTTLTPDPFELKSAVASGQMEVIRNTASATLYDLFLNNSGQQALFGNRSGVFLAQSSNTGSTAINLKVEQQGGGGGGIESSYMQVDNIFLSVGIDDEMSPLGTIRSGDIQGLNSGTNELIDSIGNIITLTTGALNIPYLGTTNGAVICTDGSSNLKSTGCTTGSGSNYWQLSAGNVGINTTNNVGIGTTLTTTSALTVMSGNVGIGTWKPLGLLDVRGTNPGFGFIAGTGGNIGIGTAVEPNTSQFFIKNAQNATNALQIQNQGGSAILTLSSGGTLSGTSSSFSSTVSASSGYDSSSGFGFTNSANTGIGTFFNSGSLQIRNSTGVGTANNSTFPVIIAPQYSEATSGVAPWAGSLAIKGPIVANGTGTTTNGATVMIMNSPSGTAVFTNPVTALTVTGGNVGLGTFSGDLNVGIGSSAPGQALDVVGTVRFSGQLLNTRSAVGIGWSEHNATNQACNTTCGSSACVMALDIGTVGVINSGFVSCSDATADDCECAGP